MGPLHQIAAAVLAAPASPAPSPSCPDAHDLCTYLFRQTGSVWFAEGSYVLLVKPARIVLIVALAIVTRFLLNRTINRIVRGSTGEKAPVLLRPLREKVPAALRDATGAVPERRRQRAEALGSVLRSIAAAIIVVVAAMLILSEVGLDLAPLLASAGIAGLAIGFGAQNLVKDFLAGVFMLLEDQYGVGDNVDLGQASGTVEAVGLRITTVRDGQGILWYIRNGEIVRVGNSSQGWALVVVDVPVGLARIEAVTRVLRSAAASLANDPQWSEDLIEEPQVLGVEQLTTDGAILRTTARTTSEARWRVGREIRRRLTAALQEDGAAGPVHLHPPIEVMPTSDDANPPPAEPTPDGGPAEAHPPPGTCAAGLADSAPRDSTGREDTGPRERRSRRPTDG
ncbi:MAG: moderate conductance mechanosensitive channel [Micromonosporaceae bacterium]|nr:moderate conductance mechanosensitive channel [Micromonosporaceae bacterium]